LIQMTSHLTLNLLSIPTPHSIITRNDAIKLIFVKLFSVSENARCDTEVEKIISKSPSYFVFLVFHAFSRFCFTSPCVLSVVLLCIMIITWIIIFFAASSSTISSSKISRI
jgi:hypothetical protein